MPRPEPTRRRLSLEPQADGVRLVVGGVWALADGLSDLAPLEAVLAGGPQAPGPGGAVVTVVGEGLESADSALTVYLAGLYDLCERREVRLDLSGIDRGIAAMVGLARAVPERAGAGRGDDQPRKLDLVGEAALGLARGADDQIRFVGEVCRSLVRLVSGRARFRGRDVLEAIEDSGPRSLGIVTVISVLIGMILAFIGSVQLRRFGAGIYVADLVGLAMTREMAAVMTGIVIAGKTGAAFAARLGTMQAQEEVDALVTLGLSPVDFLVLPRMLGLAAMMPLLYLYSCAVGLLGGMLIGVLALDLSMIEYWQQTVLAVAPRQFVIGLVKAVVFGILVAFAGCMRGIQCGRSAAAVGEATTSAVVTSILYIIVTDAVFAVVLEVYGL
jgi:phospholipid/cholesterol/gamma-HCH transport system permease protein